MDSIKFLLGFLFRLAIIFLVGALIWWLVTMLYPNVTVRSLLGKTGTSTEATDWLPAPGSWSNLFGKSKGQTGNTVFKIAYEDYSNGNNNTDQNGTQDGGYVTYTMDGTQVVGGGGVNTNSNSVANTQNGYSNLASYIRNLSIYTGGHIYTGLTFTGEARDIMFNNGKFLITIVDATGRLIANTEATAVAQPAMGWIRFQTRINAVLPNRIPCTMVFEQLISSPYMYKTKPGIRVAVPVLCN